MLKELVLVVDDNAGLREVFHRMLDRIGYCNVIEAENGEEAVSCADRFSPDLILMDINLPEKDGISAAREIMDKYPDSKIIIITGVGTPSKVIEGLKAGAANFMTKPVEMDHFKSVVEKVMGKGERSQISGRDSARFRHP